MSFIELPPEVRNLIYEHAFPSVRLLIATRDSDQALGHFRANEDDKDGSSVSINLLLTCRTVYNEAKLLVYTRSIFCFDSHTTLTSFLRRTPAQSRSVIQKVEFLQDLSGVAARNPTCAEVEIEFARWCVAYMEAERMMTGTSVSQYIVVHHILTVYRHPTADLLGHVRQATIHLHRTRAGARVDQMLQTQFRPTLRPRQCQHPPCSESWTKFHSQAYRQMPKTSRRSNDEARKSTTRP